MRHIMSNLAPSPIDHYTCHDACHPASSFIVITVGISSMLLLICVAITLLCRSHFESRRRIQNLANPSPTMDGSGHGTDVVLVLLPGEKYPVACARVAPLCPTVTKDENKQTSSEANKTNQEALP